MRRVRRKGANKEKVFGCDLLEHLTTSCQEIPLVLRCCSEFVEQNGIVDGIYRLSGVSSNIQKLRSEFESDGSPDLNKDVYLQDIHCVSSLCKAYFRELPNPLLTYQLYDKFAEAVAIQLEEERLVKIRDVLKELPAPHYRTLEFLMQHLVRMASFSTETNMHARNLAIVWAPNLLRSKDIEVSGFNGTAAFMEVRVQSIVVEFILTHVPQLFPEQGVSNQRRKSLPSPSAMPNQDEMFFKPVPTPAVANFGNISPGDGPLPIRPYHAIIEGTDKRKGSLKGRKWMSIFNIGGRFHDPRRRHKHSTKEKDRPALRPARSMDSLSTPSYPNEASRRPAQRPPPTHTSPTIKPQTQSGSDVTVSAAAIGGSEYAVTYRRGTGLVSGSAGTQGTFTALDPDANNEVVPSRSPGLSSKAGRRAGMHISGPTMVTVPLHITSNLALGVLQGGGGDRVVHRGRDKDGGDRVEGKEGGEKVERMESREMEKKVVEGRKVEEEKKSRGAGNRQGIVGIGRHTEAAGGVDDKKGEGAEEEGDQEVRRDLKLDSAMSGQNVSTKQRGKSLNSNTEEDHDEGDDLDVDDNSDYMVMKGVEATDPQPAVAQQGDDSMFEVTDVLNSTEVEGDDQELSGYVQDNFEFLDQMDCSVFDHMDCSVSYPVNEFSVEPPGHSDDEYEVMEQAQSSSHPAELQTHLQSGPGIHTQSQTELKPHRPLSLDLHNRHTKSLSLPYLTSPVHGPEESGSEEESVGDDSDDIDSSSPEDESMFIKSLPMDFFLNTLGRFEPDADTEDSCPPDRVPVHHLQRSEEGECLPMNLELSACKETTAGEQEQAEEQDRKEKEDLEEKEIAKKKEEDEVHQEQEQMENNMQSRATEEHESEKSLTSEATTPCYAEFPLPSSEDCDDSSNVAVIKVEEEKEEFEILLCDSTSHSAPCATQRETADVPSEESRDFSVRPTEHEQSCVRGGSTEKDSEDREDSRVTKQRDNICQEFVVEMKESDENTCEKPAERSGEGTADIKPEDISEQVGATKMDIWDEFEDVICELIEDEERERSEKEGAAGQADVLKDGEEEKQTEKISGEITVRAEVKEESLEASEGKSTDPVMQQEYEEDGTYLPQRRELEKTIQEGHDFNEEAQHHSRAEKENNDNKRADEQRRTLPSADVQLKEVSSDVTESKESRKCEKSDSSLEGVGRKLVVSKHPKVYQVKAVPVVPPKPQHCKITALTLRQQQQQQQQQQQHRERRETDRGRENSSKVPAEQDRDCAEQVNMGESSEKKERPTFRGGDREREKWRDGAEGTARDTSSRNSPLSMCFDEAVAIATMRREKERREGEGEAEGRGK